MDLALLASDPGIGTAQGAKMARTLEFIAGA
jgi:hypothetical protein